MYTPHERREAVSAGNRKGHSRSLSTQSEQLDGVVSFRLTPSERRMIEAAADIDEVSLSAFAREAVFGAARTRLLQELDVAPTRRGMGLS